jgi:hypothetical protein
MATRALFTPAEAAVAVPAPAPLLPASALVPPRLVRVYDHTTRLTTTTEPTYVYEGEEFPATVLAQRDRLVVVELAANGRVADAFSLSTAFQVTDATLAWEEPATPPARPAQSVGVAPPPPAAPVAVLTVRGVSARCVGRPRARDMRLRELSSPGGGGGPAPCPRAGSRTTDAPPSSCCTTWRRGTSASPPRALGVALRASPGAAQECGLACGGGVVGSARVSERRRR